MIIDSHMHLVRRSCMDGPTFWKRNHDIPQDTDLDQLVKWMKDAGVEHCVCMAQDMHRIWNSEFGEIAVKEGYEKYPDFFVPFVSVEPIDECGRFSKEKFDYVVDMIDYHSYRGIYFAPPYGQFSSNDPQMFPYYEFARDRGVVVQFHHSAAGGPTVLAHTKYVQMEKLNDVIFNFPDLKIVIEHLGYPFTEYLSTMMINDKNLWMDLAMMYHRPYWMTWNLVMAKEMGVIDRVMFASDFVSADCDLFGKNPTEDILGWVDLIENGMNMICTKAGWPTFTDRELRGILHDNAARLYNL